MKAKSLLTILLLFAVSCQQVDTLTENITDTLDPMAFQNTEFYEVTPPVVQTSDSVVKNIILMIGDGMGTAQVFAGVICNNGKLNLLNFTYTGFATTQSSDSDITDSAAGATAMACGIKTYNGAIGVDQAGSSVETILEKAEKAGLSTGLVATCRITHATPASFVAHQPSRNLYDDIAEDFTRSDLDVFIGGGLNNFIKRKDQRNLLDTLVAHGYTIVTNPDSLEFITSGKLAGLIHEEDPVRYSSGRDDYLENAASTSLEILNKDPDGFFLMIEGSQIDWGGHANDTGYLVQEMLDFDRTIGLVLEFASENPGTLIIVTADHETGGFAIVDADESRGWVKGSFSTDHHTGVMVPVFAFGPGAENFTGTMDNTDIYFKMKNLLKL